MVTLRVLVVISPVVTRPAAALKGILLFDCGEGSQRQMIRFGTGFSVDAVFFTHFHADHYLGIIGFLRTLGMGGREHALKLYGPPPAQKLLSQAIHLGIERLNFPVDVHELKGDETLDRGSYVVKAVRVDHRVNALGYVVEEKTRPGRFDPEKAKALGVTPGPNFGRIQRGETLTLLDGSQVKPEQVMGGARRGRKVVISGDTRPCNALAQAAEGADLLVHEATFSDEEQERALETRHSTAREAGKIAHQSKSQRLILTHLSSRHDVETAPLLAQARAEFKGQVDVAYDGFSIELPVNDL